MNRLIKIILLCAVISSCTNKPDQLGEDVYEQVRVEISEIKNTNDLVKYLKIIQDSDRKPRMEESQIVQEFGHDSDEHKRSWNKIHSLDLINQVRIELLFSEKSYPKKDSVGEQLSNVPIMVIHHSANGLSIRKKYFVIFYVGYQNGDISESLFELYLDRMHQIKYGDMLLMKSPYRIEQKIDTMITLLELRSFIK